MTDADLAWKRQQIAYYDEEARRGYADKHYGDAVGTGYRANYFRVQKVMSLLHSHPGTRKVLDVGCGDGWPLLCMLRDRFDAEGFDLSRPMLEAAEKRLTANKYEASRVWLGDAEEIDAYPGAPYDAVVSLGVFPHSQETLKVARNMASVLRPGGLFIGEFRNALFAMFSLNAYTYQLWDLELLPNAEYVNRAPLGSTVSDVTGIGHLSRAWLRNKLGVTELPENREPREAHGRVGFSASESAYNDLRARFHNPLEVPGMLGQAGLTPGPIIYYHFHAAPPELRGMNPKEFDRLSEKLEFTRERDWRGMFTASAFLATAYKPR